MFKNFRNVHRLNLKTIEKSIRAINRAQNIAIRESYKELQSSSLYVLLILWVAWFETSLDFILWNNICIEERVREKVYNSKNLTSSWRCLIDYLIRFHYLSNKERPINEITLGRTNYSRYLIMINLLENEIDKLILMRNRLAHGQWKVALNTEKSDVSNEATILLNTVKKVDLIIGRNVIRNFVINVSNLAHSPKHFEKQYDNRMLRIDQTKKNPVVTVPKWKNGKWIKVRPVP